MKNKIIIFMVGITLLMVIMQFMSAEVFLWNQVIVDNSTQIVNYHAYYQFDDTSATLVGANEDTRIILWYVVEPLPLDLTPDGATFGEVDWCNFTITHDKYIYDNLGNVLNTTTERSSYYFTNSSLNSSQLTFLLRNRDGLTADMVCHYTTLDGLYENNILAGRFTTYMSSYACVQCSEYSLEELSNMAEKNQNTTNNELSIYGVIQKVVDYNFQIWLILSWIIKIGLVLVAVGLIFISVYYFYRFLSNLGKELH